jgi:hypothetical protein
MADRAAFDEFVATRSQVLLRTARRQRAVLRFTVGAELLATADCGPGSPNMMQGGTSVVVQQDDIRRVGARSGQPVRVTVRSIGRRTDQRRVVGAE